MSLSQTWIAPGGRRAFVPSIVSLSPRGIPEVYPEESRPEDSTDGMNVSSAFWVLSSGPNTLVRIGSVVSDVLVTTESTDAVLSTISTSTSSAPSGFEGSLIVPLYVLIFVLSVGGNCLVLATLAQNKRMRTVTNVFLLNLAVSDLLLGVFCMPFTLVGQLLRNFVFGPIMCKLIPYFQAVSVSVSVWTLVAISLERYFAICRPLRSRRWQTRFHAYKMIAAVWVSSLLWSVPILVVSRLKALKGNLGGRHKCREEWPSSASERGFNLFVDAALLVVPLIVMALAYSLIVSKLWKGLRRELVHRRGVHGGCTNNHHTCTNLRTPCRLMRQQHMEHHAASATTRLGGSNAELSHSMPAGIGETQGVSQGGLNGRCFSANLHRQPIPTTLQHHFTMAAERCSRTSSAASHLRLFFARISRCWKTSPQPTAPPDLVLPVQQPLSQSPGRPGSVVALDGGEGTGEAGNDVSGPCPFNRHAAVRSTYVDKSVESKRKVIRMLFVVVLEFFVCWTPLHVLNTVYLFNPEAVYSTVGATGVSLVQLLAYAASCTNPITYCFMNRRFRAAFRRVFDCCSSRGGSGVGPGVLGSENTGMGAAIRMGRRGRRRRGRQRGKTLWRWHSAAGPLGGRSADCAFSTAIATELGVASEDASAVESALDLGATCRHSGCSKSDVNAVDVFLPPCSSEKWSSWKKRIVFSNGLGGGSTSTYVAVSAGSNVWWSSSLSDSGLHHPPCPSQQSHAGSRQPVVEEGPEDASFRFRIRWRSRADPNTPKVSNAATASSTSASSSDLYS